MTSTQKGVENSAFDGEFGACQDVNSKKYEVSSMEELLEMAGTRTWNNYLIYFFCLWVVFASPFLLLSYQFLGATPEYWCQVPELEMANWTETQIKNYTIPLMSSNDSLGSCEMLNLNYSEVQTLDYETAIEELDSLRISNETIECSRRSFDSKEPETVVTKWDLVCERRALYSTTQAAPQFGKLVGAFVMGSLVNVVGRKKTICIIIPIFLAINLVTVLSPNAEVYIFLKFLVSVLQMGLPIAGIILAFELCSTSQRAFLGSMFNMPLAIGFMILPGIAYLVRPFTQLQIALSLPTLTLFPCFWILPESPRWLMLKGRYHEAVEVLRKLAKSNGNTLPPEEAMLTFMKRVHDETKTTSESKSTIVSYFSSVAKLMLDRSWCWKLMIIFFGWTSGAMVFYGTTFNAPNLSQDKYLYTFLIALLQVPSVFLTWLVSCYLGRKKSMCVLYITGSLAILAVALISIRGYQESNTGWVLFLSLVGDFSTKCAYMIIWFYTPELIPTEQRSEILGLTNAFARIGSISSPYIVDLLGVYSNWIPSLIFGVSSLVAGFLIAFLPETKNSQLSEHK